MAKKIILCKLTEHCGRIRKAPAEHLLLPILQDTSAYRKVRNLLLPLPERKYNTPLPKCKQSFHRERTSHFLLTKSLMRKPKKQQGTFDIHHNGW